MRMQVGELHSHALLSVALSLASHSAVSPCSPQDTIDGFKPIVFELNHPTLGTCRFSPEH